MPIVRKSRPFRAVVSYSTRMPPAAVGAKKYAMSYITPTGFGKNVRLGSYKPITPTGFWKAADKNLPPAAGGAKKYLSRRVAL